MDKIYIQLNKSIVKLEFHVFETIVPTELMKGKSYLLRKPIGVLQDHKIYHSKYTGYLKFYYITNIHRRLKIYKFVNGSISFLLSVAKRIVNTDHRSDNIQGGP